MVWEKLLHTRDVSSWYRAALPPETRLGDLADLFACLVAAGLLSVSYAGSSGAPRLLLALAFTFFVPGRAIVTNWPLMARWSEAAVCILLSLAVLVLLATVTLWAHVWYPVALFQVEAWLSLAGLGIGMARRHTRWLGRAQVHGRRHRLPPMPG